MADVSYIQVVLPLKLAWIPTYRAQSGLERGARVRVMFSHKEYVGVVWNTDVTPDVDPSRILDVLEVMGTIPSVSGRELELWEFLSTYYICTPGEVYKAAYPTAKIRSEKTAARTVADHLRREKLTRDKMILSCETRLRRLKERLSKKDEQLSKPHNETVTSRLEQERDALLLEIYSVEDSLRNLQSQPEPAAPLKPVLGAPEKHGDPGRPLILVGGDRCARYESLIRETLEGGRDVLLLTADILFSCGLERRLRPVFPEMILVNSKQSQASRRKASDRLRESTGNLVLGTRSAIFLPFHDLGLVIIDEEQDTSFKQEDPNPRYNGRDCALKLALIHSAKVVLGTACPSLESIHNVETGKFSEEILPGSLAPVDIVDVRAERRKKGMSGIFSFKLIDAISSTPGRVTLIRGWERRKELDEEIDRLFPSRDIRVMTLIEAKSDDFADDSLVAILQADALVRVDDFRADERARQIVVSLAAAAPRLVVQTSVPQRFDGSRSMADLLLERRRFGYPPFTRLVQTRQQGHEEPLSQFFLPKDRILNERKRAIRESVPDDVIIDVDPV